MAVEALFINLFIWCFLLIAVLLSAYFMEAQDSPQITVLIFVLANIEMALFFAISMRMVHERDLGIEQARLNQQYALQMQHTNEINALYQDMRQTRHEMKNQAIYVRHLLEERDYPALEAYYQGQSEETDSLLRPYDSGNRLVNAILWAKLRAAERHGIPVELHAAVPEELPVKGHHLYWSIYWIMRSRRAPAYAILRFPCCCRSSRIICFAVSPTAWIGISCCKILSCGQPSRTASPMVLGYKA